MADNDPPAANPYDDGVKRIRETTKWLTVSLGSIGAVLAGGLQLTSLGKLDSNSGRSIFAIIALGIACLGIALILGAALVTMTCRPAGTDDVKKLNQGKYQQFLGGATPEKLTEDYNAASAQRIEDYTSYLHDQTQDSGRRYDTAVQNLTMIADRLRGLIAVADYKRVALRWKVTIGMMAIGVIAVVVGVAWFAWAVNPPDPAPLAETAVGVTSNPKDGEVTLNDAGRAAVQAAGGDNCLVATSALRAQLLKTTDSGPDVVIAGSDSCEPVHVLLVEAWGTFKARS